MSLTSLTTGISDYATRRAIQQLASKLNYDASPTFAGLTISGEALSSTLITQWSTAYSWGDHAGLYDTIGAASGEIDDHESTYDHSLLHSPVTLGTANGLTLNDQELSLPTTATPTFAGLTLTGLLSGARSVTTTGQYAGFIELVMDTSGGDIGYGIGAFYRARCTGTNGITNNLTGSYGVAQHAGSGTVNLARGVVGEVYHTGGGVITTSQQLTANSPYITSGTIGTAHGLYVNAQKIDGVTTGYGIRQVGSSDINNFVGKCKFGTAGTPAENVHASDTVRADIAFNLNGTDGVTQASSAGKVCDVTALAGGIATAQTQVTYATDGTYNFDATAGKVSSITITNGRITSITTA